jgi:bifunctional DNA-binding transcriptional regulator/antitoxin component of YhaV-PrlF toxin-antitoxin module
MRYVKQTPRRGRPRRDRTRISSKNQVTLPIDALEAAGLGSGDTLRVAADGPGRLVLTRERDVVATFAGRLSGVYGPGYLDELRDEWA